MKPFAERAIALLSGVSEELRGFVSQHAQREDAGLSALGSQHAQREDADLSAFEGQRTQREDAGLSALESQHAQREDTDPSVLERRHDLADVAAFAFWCRRVHLEQMKKVCMRAGEIRLGRGVSLHFAPGNLPVQFAFTAAVGILAGNSVIVRLPRKCTPQEQAVIQAFQRVMEHSFQEFQQRLFFVRYGHEPSVTEALSSLCDVRVIWGSDASVSEIRRAPLPARAIDLPFPARDSVAVFHAQKALCTKKLDQLCEAFYNDTYQNDQNACSSPHVIYWVGNPASVQAAQDRFWEKMRQKLSEKSWRVQPATAVAKLDGALQIAAEGEGIQIIREDNALVRIQTPSLSRKMWKYMQPGGFFLESAGTTWDPLLEMLDSTCQTVSVFGFSETEIAASLAAKCVQGADRIVPVGHALDFGLIWDGFHLIDAMSRRIYHESLL